MSTDHTPHAVRAGNGTRTFGTGATRSDDTDRPDYEGFLSPTALVRYGAYMTAHRRQPDGSLRASDNWQRGIPIASYVKSMFRHFVEVWLGYRRGSISEDALCALWFNVQGLLHEVLKRSEPIGYSLSPDHLARRWASPGPQTTTIVTPRSAPDSDGTADESCAECDATGNLLCVHLGRGT